MPEKKMLKKSNLFKTKRTSQQNGRTKSVNKNDSCKTFFLSCAKGTNLYIQMSILDIWKNPK